MTPSIHYTAEGSGYPVVFQHGLGADSRQIRGLVTPDNFLLLTSDSRGHGKSELGGHMPSFDRFADDVIEILNRENIEKAIFGGLSMGAGIAVNAAIRYPTRVCGLILLRPAWLCERNPPNLDILTEIASHLDNGGTKEEFKTHQDLMEMRQVLPEAAASVEGMFSRVPANTTSTLLRHMVSDRPCNPEQPERIDVPSLIIGNDDDPLHPWKMAEEWAGILRGELVRIPSRYIDADGHKRAVNNEIMRFIRKLKSR